MAQRHIGKVIALFALGVGVQLACIAPAQAARDLSALGPVSFPQSGMTVYGSAPAIDNDALSNGVGLPTLGNPAIVGSPPSSAAVVPEPAGWLMMVVGFGLLGAMTRRSMSSAEAARHVV